MNDSTESGFMGAPVSKSMSSELAKKLWPPYLKVGGNLSAVLDWCKKNEVEISKPTLDKLAKNFGWKEKLKQAQQNAFSASSDLDGDLASIRAELLEYKEIIRTGLVASPLDQGLHSLYGQYIGRIMELNKLDIQARAGDSDAIKVSTLNAVVDFLQSNNQLHAVELIADNLESIAEMAKVK